MKQAISSSHSSSHSASHSASLAASLAASTASSLAPTSHLDTFTRERLPPQDQWPVFVFDRPEIQYPEQINCVQALLDVHVAQG